MLQISIAKIKLDYSLITIKLYFEIGIPIFERSPNIRLAFCKFGTFTYVFI